MITNDDDVAERPQGAAGSITATRTAAQRRSAGTASTELQVSSAREHERDLGGFSDPSLSGAARYELLDEHGRGGLGRVIRAHDRQLGREVVVKELLVPSPDSEARFVREALITSRLEHPGIVPVYSAGVREDGSPFYAMKKISGRPLRQLIARARSYQERLRLLPNVIAVAEAVSYAHSEQIVHRDIKPSNVVIGDYGETVVIDWGLAKDLAAGDEDPADPVAGDDADAEDLLTVAGSVIGTPAYMAPEQARGQRVDKRADVYSLGALLYHVLAGAPPYEEATADRVLAKAREAALVPIGRREPRVPDDLAAIVDKAMARKPAARYPSAKELSDDLSRYQAGKLVGAHDYSTWQLVRRWVARHRTLTIALVAVVAIAAGAFQQVTSQRDLALRERDAKEAQRKRADQQTLALLEQQGHAELRAGRPFHAAGQFQQVYSRGVDTLSLRLGLGEAMRDVDSLEHTLRGHEAGLWFAAYSPDGAQVATASDDNTARIWDATTGQLRHTLRGHRSVIWHLAYSPDGSRLVTASMDATVRVWETATGQLVRTLHGHEAPVQLAVYSPDQEHILTASADKTARVWDASTGQLVRTLRGHIAPLAAAAYNPDGTRIVTASFDGTATIWDRATGEQVRTLHPHDAAVLSAAYSPDGKRVITASADKTVRIWDADSGQLKHTLCGHDAEVLSAAYSPDGARIITSSLDKTVRIWDAATGQVVRSLPGHGAVIKSAAYSPDGAHILTASWDKTARIWRADTGGLLGGHRDRVAIAKFSHDGRWLLSWSWDGAVQLWDAGEQRLSTVWRKERQPQPWTVAFSPDSTLLAATLNVGTVPQILRVDNGAVEAELRGHEATVFCIDFSPDGARLVTASGDGTVRLWNARSGEQLGEPMETSEDDRVISARFHPDGRHVVVGANSGAITIWDCQTRQVVGELEGHATAVKTASYGPDGHQILSAGWDDHLAKVWDASTNDLLFTLEGHDDRIFWASYSPDGRVIATAGLDQKARFWDAQSGELLHVLDGPSFSADFDPNGTRIAVGGEDGYLRVLRLETRTADEIEAVLQAKGLHRD